MKPLKMKTQVSDFHTILKHLCYPIQKPYAERWTTEEIKGNSSSVIQMGDLEHFPCVFLDAMD